ncbi:DUF169 domain-containing protein [Desulfatitalea alkaliphila]|uniref:DUF169 domain-containing protein n=1 Tax=Desulfatitalea alkaliphila TaxID=2929485 RepID=A0AA41UKP9_9BACT|nr:DUF169 domain-containing protein [Desulfatitalea alkaliphila]MCJ8502529.1 DUF169 domain-containing protein [Desulfatitalea alkaliphila]
MQSQIHSALELSFAPVAVVRTNDKPENARQFKERRWGCVMFMLAAAAAQGAQAVFDRSTYGCWGGGVGLGFGNQYKNFPGGEDGFCHFLSIGNAQSESGRQVGEQIKPHFGEDFYDDFMQGERYQQSPQRVRQFIDELPIVDNPETYVVFKPLEQIAADAPSPEVVVFLGDMDQIAGLTILANYHRPTNDNVIFPYAAGCQSIGIHPFAEAQREQPRAVLGLNDISARLALKRILKKDVLSFAVPYRLFQEMEANVAGSFIERNTWRQLRALTKKESGK